MKKTMLLMMAAGLLAGQALAGYQITMKSVSEGDRKGRQGQAGMQNNTVVMSADGEKARIDFTEGHGPVAGKGGYLITQDAGRTFFMVSPKDKTYMKWDMEAMMGLAGAMGGMMKMQISDPKVERILDEAGEPILDYPTRHYKFRTAYRMAMNVMGFKNEMTIDRQEEVWSTTSLDVSAVGAWVNNMPKTQNEELDKLIKAEKGKMTGVPLKMLSIQTSTDSQGKVSVVRTSMNVTGIRKIGASEVSVKIPEDYKEVNLFPAAGQDGEQQDPGASRRQAPPKIDFGSMMKKALESAR